MKFITNTSAKTEINDQLLLNEYHQSGSLEVLGQLYGRYMHLVYGVCLKYLRDEEESKDAVMQIFEQLISKLKIHQVSNFKSWLYMLARNYCLMKIRSSRKHEVVHLEDDFMEKDGFVHLDIDDTREHKLTVMEKCMQELSPEQRDTINLFYLEQKCYKEVAELTGFDLNKVKSYIQNGKRNLKICIEKNGEE